MSEPIFKTTEFTGQISNDGKHFYFDKRSIEQIKIDKKLGDVPERLQREDEARIYLNDLLPDAGEQRGQWRITVEFTPEDG